jgi:phosphoenolpyruvate carboxykinase (ATP)
MTNEGFKEKGLSRFRVIAESAFQTNNVFYVKSVKEAYKMSLKNKGTIILDQKIYKAKENGFPKDASVLVFNDGAVVGRMAGARRILGEEGVDPDKFSLILREAVYKLSQNECNYHAESYIGLHEDFMVKANLLVPKGFENTVLSWLVNFQETNEKYKKMYKKSKKINENDIFIVSDPNWSHEDFPYGLTFFSPEENVAFILGMRYFGEFKKGTLTLAWGLADRNEYTSCHGGLKSYNNLNFVSAFFGLSGSGKSTLTHARHKDKYDITILHDDAFIINDKTHHSIALEPSYFDKTSDYKVGAKDNKFILTAQNVGVCRNERKKKVLITEDVRNSNGRAIKSRFWSPNRVDKMQKEINAVFWLMKDSTIPPVVKINNSILAAVMGATLATKRTSAERLAKGVDPNALVIEPYANPFRTYPLSNDFNKFKTLFDKGVDCYILNTGFFLDKKVKPEHTLSVLEKIAERKKIKFKPLFNLKELEFFDCELKVKDTKKWQETFKMQMEKRLKYISSLNKRNALSKEALKALKDIVSKI